MGSLENLKVANRPGLPGPLRASIARAVSQGYRRSGQVEIRLRRTVPVISKCYNLFDAIKLGNCRSHCFRVGSPVELSARDPLDSNQPQYREFCISPASSGARTPVVFNSGILFDRACRTGGDKFTVQV